MQQSEFYLNDKIVSVQLYDKELDNGFIWIDKFTYTTYVLGRKKTIDLNGFKWCHSEDIIYYACDKKLKLFNNDEELLSFLNKKVNHFQIIEDSGGKKLYISPSVQFKYVNGDIKTIYFDTIESAERYYNDLKRNFNGNYIIFL